VIFGISLVLLIFGERFTLQDVYSENLLLIGNSVTSHNQTTNQ